MILLIDNYDSFVHNLARYIGELGEPRDVIRNDAASAEEIIARAPRAIIISPGPCGPDDAGISVSLVHAAARARIPLLGVCLGHQCIAAAFGGTIRRAEPVHGRASAIRHKGHALFDGIADGFPAARYHSLVAELGEHSPLRPIAHLDDGTLMALAHHNLPIYGVQFHPESVLTQHGHKLLRNFLNITASLAKVDP